VLESILLACSLAALAPESNAQTVLTMLDMPNVPYGQIWSRASAISADGRVVVGATSYTAFRWTASEGGSILSYGWSSANCVSADGSVIAGSLGTGRAARWTAGSGTLDIGALPGNTTAQPYAISLDGSTIVGFSTNGDSGDRGFVWTQASGIRSIGVLAGGSGSFATAVSADGAIVFGNSNATPVRWTHAEGLVPLSFDLPGSLLGAINWSSSSGGVLIGHTFGDGASWGMYVPFCSRDGAVQFLTQAREYFPAAASADAAVVVGMYRLAGGVERAFRWSADAGMMPLKDYLAARGADVSQWLSLNRASGVSADGRTIVGWGTRLADNATQAFIAVEPSLPDADGDGWPDSVDNCTAVLNPDQADCDHDGIGNACDVDGDFNANGVPDSCECLADLFVDRQVNGADLGVLLAFWGPVNPGFPQADMNRDGKVDGADLGHLLASWGPCTN